MNEQYWGRNVVVSAVAAVTLSGAAACGSGFSADDCKTTRTCATTPQVGGAGSSPDVASSAGASDGSQAGDAANVAGADLDGSGGLGGAAGVVASSGDVAGAAAADAGCRVAKDCSNGDPADGEESCAEGICVAGNAPPTVVAVTPNDKAVNTEPDGTIVLQFSEPLDPKTAIAANIQVLDGAAAVAGDLTYADDKVTFKPKAPLSLLTPYSVAVSTKVTDADGAALLKPFQSAFTVRDGVWSVKSAVTDTIYQVAPTLPMTDDAQALVTWIAITNGSKYCPTSARWFSRGTGVGTVKKLTGDDVPDCATVRAAGTSDGQAVVSWREDAGAKAVIYKAGTWQQQLPLSGNASVYQAAIARGPGDMAHYLEVELSGGVDAYWWDTVKAKWTQDPLHISTETVLSEPQMAVAKNGRVYAVWRARDALNREKIASAMFEPDLKKWLVAQDLKGSVAASAGAGYERGAPSIAVDENGDAMALWVRGNGNGTTYQLMASRFRYTGAGWEDPNAISGTLSGLPRTEPAALTFDGKTYVAAWTALVGNVNNTYVARFDRTSEGWSDYQLVSDGVVKSVARMPRLGADTHQNLVVTWPAVSNTANVFNLTYQRYNASTGKWATALPVTGGSMSDSGLATSSPFPLGVSGSGPAAAMWGTRSASGLSAVQLASFY